MQTRQEGQEADSPMAMATTKARCPQWRRGRQHARQDDWSRGGSWAQQAGDLFLAVGCHGGAREDSPWLIPLAGVGGRDLHIRVPPDVGGAVPPWCPSQSPGLKSWPLWPKLSEPQGPGHSP